MTNNRICKLLGIRYPIFQGAMLWVTAPKLVASVSNSGGLGIIAASNLDQTQLEKQIQEVRSLTEKPFGVNVPLRNPLADEQLEYICSEKFEIVLTTGGSPRCYTEKLKGASARVLHMVSNTRQAENAEKAGVDAVIAQGVEAGGHLGPDELTHFVLIPQLVDRIRIPVVAAGGICDVRGFLAALALGGEGVQLGTRFIASTECEAHPEYKKAILNALDTDTVLVGRKSVPRRLLKNRFSLSVIETEGQGASAEEIKKLISRDKSIAGIKGDVMNGSVVCGQGLGMIKEIMSVEEIIEALTSPCREELERIRMDIPFLNND